MGAAARARVADAAKGRSDAFLVEGRKAVRDALSHASLHVREAWLADDLPREEIDDLVRAAARRRVPVGLAAARDLDRASAVATPQGAVALVDDAGRDVATVLREAGDAPVLLLDRVQDPGNVGAVLRVAAALGAGGVILTDGSAHPMGPKALRASAGTALLVPFARAAARDVVAALRDARRPLWLLDGTGEDLFSRTARPAGLVLAVGSEGGGPSEEVRAAAAACLAIPIRAEVESLNAAVAAGIGLSHVVRLPVRGGARAPTSG
jgi:TrmH family RNA methyltransferase